MPQALTIALPDDVHQRLLDLSRRRGESPQALAEALVAEAVRRAAADPLRRWAGAFESGVPDAAERHDDYLADSLARELTGDA
jgi:predicted transcriptional regulator